MIYKIKELTDIDDNNEKWGGKATALSNLIKLGFNVPTGFVVPTDYYIEYTKNKLNTCELENILNGYYKSVFRGANPQVICRSSANVEGKKKAPFCGVFESYVFDTEKSFVENIELVWKSAQSSSALKYLRNSTNDVLMAVIIQQVIFGEFCAVVQSYDIVQDEKRIIIEYSTSGLDAVVNGEENSHLAYIDYNSNAIDYIDDSPQLDEHLVKSLRESCTYIEEKLGVHVELELQIQNNELFFLQVRSI